MAAVVVLLLLLLPPPTIMAMDVALAARFLPAHPYLIF